MTDQTIDAARAYSLLEQAVAGHEDFTYTPPRTDPDTSDGSGMCLYVHDGAPSCVVGHALYLSGIPLERIQLLDTSAGNRSVDAGALSRVTYSDLIGVKVTRKAALVFSAAQELQDDGSSWGDALAAARDIIETDPTPDVIA